MKKLTKWLILVAALASLACLMFGPFHFNKVAADDDEDVQTKFFFAVVNQAPGTTDRITLSGAGRFGKHGIEGGGGFTHYTTTSGPPFPIVAHGTYRATKLVSFAETPGSPYGEQISGILEMEVELQPVGGEPIKGATMKVVCNVPAGVLFTGEDEGVTLTVPGGLTFEHQTPAAGVTLFNPAKD
jgi:hypothetical protein